MSADNWAVCPLCVRLAKQEKLALYGKVSEEEYLDAVKRYDKIIASSNENTLREDYDIGISKDGTFTVSYSGSCKRCGLKYQYKYSTPVELEKAPQ